VGNLRNGELTRFLAKLRKSDEALTILSDIYNWFTEGFDTADLKDAKHCSKNYPRKPARRYAEGYGDTDYYQATHCFELMELPTDG
jgi:hypothetical protein